MAIFNDFIVGGTYVQPTKYKVEGVLTIEDQPYAFRRVIVVNRQTMEILAATVTDAEGNFSMTGLPDFGVDKVMVIGQEETGNYNAKCFDHVTMTAYPIVE